MRQDRDSQLRGELVRALLVMLGSMVGSLVLVATWLFFGMGAFVVATAGFFVGGTLFCARTLRARKEAKVERELHTPKAAGQTPSETLVFIADANDTANEVEPAPAATEEEIDISPSLDADDWESTPPSTLDLDALSRQIVGVADPISRLKLFVGDIRTREAESPEKPSPYERFAARVLAEAGLFESDELPALRIVRPPASSMFYLRVHERQPSFSAMQRTLAIEAALNALRFSDTYFDNPDATSIEEHYQLQQKLAHSVTAQSPNLWEQVPIIQDDSPDTEWAVRLGISTAIESFQLPYRLTATWRVNVADGNVAFELELPGESLFPATRYVEDLGLVATSKEMRRKAASDYALRLALLVASAAFRCSERVKHVWVAGFEQTATRRMCLLSVDFDRWRFSRLDLTDLGSLPELYHAFAPTLRYEDGILRPVEQGFSLDERRFCPPRRFEAPALSTRKIARPYAEMLGCDHVFGLAIDEASKRERIAAEIVGQLGSSTEQNVKLILQSAADDPDPTIRTAAERTVEKLIAGSLDENPQAVGQEFVAGDALSVAVRAAGKRLAQQDPAGAEQLLRSALDPLDEAKIYADSAQLEYRFFSNYVERALYNRLFAMEGRLPQLVPQAYVYAHFLLSVAQLMQGRPQDALLHARRLVELAPLDARAHVHLTRCLELLGQDKEAVDALSHLLAIAHDPEGVGMAYYRMAYFQWKAGHLLAAQACYAYALRFMPAYAPVITMEVTTLALQEPGAFREELDERMALQALRDQDIPIAPTEEMSRTFLECARASLDAEVFPVARNFAWILGAFSGDDILVGLLRSIEEGPAA